jgi:hypothetical protein
VTTATGPAAFPWFQQSLGCGRRSRPVREAAGTDGVAPTDRGDASPCVSAGGRSPLRLLLSGAHSTAPSCPPAASPDCAPDRNACAPARSARRTQVRIKDGGTQVKTGIFAGGEAGVQDLSHGLAVAERRRQALGAAHRHEVVDPTSPEATTRPILASPNTWSALAWRSCTVPLQAVVASIRPSITRPRRPLPSSSSLSPGWNGSDFRTGNKSSLRQWVSGRGVAPD